MKKILNFEIPLYFEDQKGGVGGSTFQYPSGLKFMFLETEQGVTLRIRKLSYYGANSDPSLLKANIALCMNPKLPTENYTTGRT